LRDWELGLLLFTLAPDDFVHAGRGCKDNLFKHFSNTEFAHKLGYGKPRGLGSVRVKIDKCKLLPETDEQKFIEKSREDWPVWIEAALSKLPDKPLRTWLRLLAWDPKEGRCDYPKGKDNKVYTYHTEIRTSHAKARRQKQNNPKPDPRLLKRP
jgi:hypothetical protein